MSDSNAAPVIIKRVKKAAHGHHGGAWKIAYADFVTAMMAFFLLMWLINTTSPEQKRGIADYFAPANISRTTSGGGGLLGGKSFSSEGARANGAQSPEQKSKSAPQTETKSEQSSEEAKSGTGGEQQAAPPSEKQIDDAIAQREQKEFEMAEQSLRQAMQDLPELAELSKNLIIDQTPEGLRIQIVDQEGRPMFPPGSAEPYDRAVTLIGQVAKVVQRLPNRISISGHTDSASFVSDKGYSNWDLSADRANTSRRILQSAGVANDRIYQVSGKAGSEPLFPNDPYLVGNRRISIVLLREAPVLPASLRR